MTIHINHTEKALVNGTTGEILRLPCFNVLVSYHSYLVGRGHTKAAEHLLDDAFSGDQVISNMIDGVRGCSCANHPQSRKNKSTKGTT